MVDVALSGPMEVNLDVYRGDTGRFRLTVNDGAQPPAPIDVSLADWDADIRSTGNSPTVVAQLVIEPVEGDTASVDVILDETNATLLTAGTLVYDVEMRLNNEVITLIKGTMTVTQDVSRPT